MATLSQTSYASILAIQHALSRDYLNSSVDLIGNVMNVISLGSIIPLKAISCNFFKLKCKGKKYLSIFSALNQLTTLNYVVLNLIDAPMT